MLLDALPVHRFLAVWSATGSAYALQVMRLIFSLFRGLSRVSLLVGGLTCFAIELVHVAAPGVESIRRAARQLADSIQPRAPPFAA